MSGSGRYRVEHRFGVREFAALDQALIFYCISDMYRVKLIDTERGLIVREFHPVSPPSE